ncbi:MAG: hypothetical protein D8H92_10955 [Campylobacter sp.]|nr:MAG: hypothetical protein D8H92_10955 [Campylobacter sp.]
MLRVCKYKRQAYKNSAPLGLIYRALRSGWILKFNLRCVAPARGMLCKFKAPPKFARCAKFNALRKILNFTAAQIARRFGLDVYFKPAKLGGKISTSPP